MFTNFCTKCTCNLSCFQQYFLTFNVLHNEIYELFKTFLQIIMASRILDTYTDSLKNHMIWLKRKVQIFNKNLAENSESTVPNQSEETRLAHGSDQEQSNRKLNQEQAVDNLPRFVGQMSPEAEIESSESDRQGDFGNAEEAASGSIFGARPLQPSLQSTSSVFSAPTLTDIISINDDSFKLPRYQRELYEKKTNSSRLRQLVSEHRENKESDLDDGTEQNMTSSELPDQKRPKYTFVPGPPPTSCRGSLDQEMLDNLDKNSGTPHNQTAISTKTSAATVDVKETTAFSPRMRRADYLIPKPGPNENVDDWIRGMELLLGLSVDSRLSDVTETDVEASYENPFQHSSSRHEPLPGQVDDSDDETAAELGAKQTQEDVVIPCESNETSTKKPLRIRTRNAVRRVCTNIRRGVRSVVNIIRRKS